MTWKKLQTHIAKMDKEQLATDVTIFDSNVGEFFIATTIHFATDEDPIDENQPFLYLES